MEIITLLLIALGLSMDAFAVSVSNGMHYINFQKQHIFLTAVTFGLFQALMPVLGYFAGSTFSQAIASIDHWVALILLGFIGGRMIFEAVRELKHPKNEKTGSKFSLHMLLLQGIATSIDAFAVGISFAVIGTDIVLAGVLIGVITFICCALGAFLGKKFGGFLKQKAEIFGGCILILIGLKIFIEHMLGGT